MATVWQQNGFDFVIHTNEPRFEPPHVHVRKGRQEVKFWLDDASVAALRHVPEHQLKLLRRKVVEQQSYFMEAWHVLFG